MLDNMDDYDDYIETRLQEWANWYIKASDNGLGYPRRSIEGKLVDEGFCVKQGYSRRIEPTNSSAEELESLVVEMGYYNPNLLKAIKYEYTKVGTQSYKAQTLGISLAQFKTYLKIAKAWLLGRLMQSITNRAVVIRSNHANVRN